MTDEAEQAAMAAAPLRLTPELARQRAALGYAHLTEMLGDGWRERMNPASLAMDHAYDCVVARATGMQFWAGMHVLFPQLSVSDGEWEKEVLGALHGYYAVCRGRHDDGCGATCTCEESYRLLDAAWRELLAA
jgi:hypothetical protein